MTWDDVLGYINGAGLGHLATASVQGEPHSALVFVVRRGDDLYFTMRTTSNKARNLVANPRLSVMWQGNGAETYLWGEVADAHTTGDFSEKIPATSIIELTNHYWRWHSAPGRTAGVVESTEVAW